MKNLFLAIVILAILPITVKAQENVSFNKAQWVQKIDYINASQGRSDALTLQGQIIFNDRGYCLIKISTEQVPCQIQRLPFKRFNALLAIIDSSKYIEILRRFSEKKSSGGKALQIFQEYLEKSPTTGIFAGFESTDLENVTNTEAIPSSDANELLELISYPGKVSQL